MIKFTDENINQFIPSSDAVLVRYDKTENITESGIILVEKKSVTKRPDRGIVISIGKDVKEVKCGDNVVFNSQSGYDIYENDNSLFILLQEAKIFGILI